MADPLETEDFREDAISYDADDPKAVNNARKRAARLRKKRTDFVRAMMDQHEGRMWIYDILCMCHAAENTEVLGHPHATSFRNGERNIGLRITADISESAPDQWMTMMTEGKSEK